MKKSIFLLVALILSISVSGQDQFLFDWTAQSGSPDYDYVFDMDTDDAGNVYTFLQTPWSECHIADSVFYGYGLYVTKLNTEGAMVWTSYISCTSTLGAKNLRATPEGEVYILGIFNETANFGPFTLVDTSLSFVHFLAKLNTDGSFAWAEIVYPSPDFVALDMEIDPDENIYVTGYNPGYYMIIGADTIFGDQNGYKMPLIQFDSVGTPVWGIMTDNNTLARGTDLEFDRDGNIIIAGDFKGLKLYYGQDSIVPVLPDDLLLASITPGVGFNWVRLSGYDGSLYLLGMAVDTAGEIYVTGRVRGDFFFSEDTINIPDFFPQFGLFGFSPDGEFDWHLASTSVGNYHAEAIGHDICLDNDGNLFVTGIFNRVIEIGDYTLIANPPATNYYNFLIQVSPKGRVLLAETIYGKTDYEDYAQRKVRYCGDYLYYSGAFGFTGIIGNEEFTSYGLIDGFISKIDLLYVSVPEPVLKIQDEINIYSHSGRIYINNLSIEKKYTVNVLNMAGQVVAEIEINGFQEYSFPMNTSDGIYLVSVNDGMEKQASKIIYLSPS